MEGLAAELRRRVEHVEADPARGNSLLQLRPLMLGMSESREIDLNSQVARELDQGDVVGQMVSDRVGSPTGPRV